MTRYQWSETKYRKTKSWQSQPEFDKFIGDLDISSLRALAQKRQKDIRYFRNNNDLNIPENQEKNKNLEQQIKMISDELAHREMDRHATISYEQRYDSETGAVLDSDGQVLYCIDFNEDEDVYIVNYRQVTNIYEEDDYDEPVERKRTRKEIYENWDYVTG